MAHEAQLLDDLEAAVQLQHHPGGRDAERLAAVRRGGLERHHARVGSRHAAVDRRQAVHVLGRVPAKTTTDSNDDDDDDGDDDDDDDNDDNDNNGNNSRRRRRTSKARR